MKRKQILARAITLGLLLAMPCSAWAETIEDGYKFSGSKTLTENTTYTGGLLIAKDASITGDDKSLDIQGYFYNKEGPESLNFEYTRSGDSIDFTDIKDEDIPYINGKVGLANLGSITEVNVLKFSEKLENRGNITATTLDLTENRYNGAHNDTNGNMVLDNIKGYFLSNDTWVDFYITTFSNDGKVLVNNSIKTDVTNNTSGVITYNGTEAISGDLQNAGTVIVTSGNLKITDGRLTVQGTSSQLLGANGTYLQSLEVVDDGIEIGSSWQSGSLIVDGIITTKFVNNHGTVQSNNLQITGDMDDEDVYGGTNYSGATMLISNSISLANGSLLNNKGNVLFVGESAQISGNGIINNLLDNNVIGIIAKNADGDKITNLTIEGTLNNSGIIATETLNVANGTDTADSKSFNVDNLNILGNDSQDANSFALKKDNYTFTNVGVGENASLTAAGSLGVNGTMALQDGASVETLAENG
ncbi:hypothetical protein, partial [uncultured Phascolarctobacterium sp.]|uniref:hypothetical protein n=1 Tax=uncultured Phascolarctobacterium sp. TaxID=512296 RepID=UPI0025FC1131